MHSFVQSRTSFLLLIFLAIIFGAGLRVYQICDQVLLDDEWHGMNYAIGNKFSYLLTHFSIPGATCIPLNLYRLFLLNTFGWSELLLRLPSLAGGILSLIIFPVFVKKILSRRATVIFTCLLAISPFLIFYSRMSRPYSIYAFFGFVSVLALYLWVSSGERKYGVIYAAAGVLAVYFHIFAVVAVFGVLGFVFIVKFLQKFINFGREKLKIVISLKLAGLTFCGMVLVLSGLVGPGLLQSRSPAVISADKITFGALCGFASMLSGTGNELVTILFCILFACGVIALFRKRVLFGSIYIWTIVFYFLAIFISRAESINAALVVSRYFIVVFPLGFIAVAAGTDRLLLYLQSSALIRKSSYGTLLSNLIAAALLSVFFFSGPLIKLYSQPNNFTNHSAYQESYEPISWEQSYRSDVVQIGAVMKKTDVPGFYQQLSEDLSANKIIEYPMMLGNSFNLYYYYQHFHKKRVFAGYYTGLPVKDMEPRGYIAPYIFADQVLSRMSDSGRLKFRNMVNMTDIEAVKKSTADYVILHKALMVEMIGELAENRKRFEYLPVKDLTRIYQQYFGLPVFQDDDIVVFKIFQ